MPTGHNRPMTSVEAAPTTTTESPETVIDRFLEAVVTGQGAAMAGLYAPDAVLDATVPGWRFRVKGAEAIAAQYAGWFADSGRFEELDRRVSGDDEFVTYLLAWEENGIPHAAHHCHRLSIDAAGLIAADQVFCGGRWSATLLAEMAEAENAG